MNVDVTMGRREIATAAKPKRIMQRFFPNLAETKPLWLVYKSNRDF